MNKTAIIIGILVIIVIVSIAVFVNISLHKPIPSIKPKDFYETNEPDTRMKDGEFNKNVLFSPFYGKFLNSSGKMVSRQEDATLFVSNGDTKLSPKVTIAGKQYTVQLTHGDGAAFLTVEDMSMALKIDKDIVALVNISQVPKIIGPEFALGTWHGRIIKFK